MIFCARNLTELTVKPELPWEFKATAEIPEKVRKGKVARQAWYKAATTDHQFYSLIEGANPNMRVSKGNNPPRVIHGFGVDYDLPITLERANEAIASMRFKPSWIERSLGGNLRLVWLLEQPIIVEDFDFCVATLTAAAVWLQLDLLPGLDEPAFLNPTRMLCNGCEWHNTGFSPISTAESQAFFVQTAKEFNFQTSDPITIPLDVVEAAIKEKFPNFSWPADFTPDTQGPSFWIPESTSPASAILKPEGFITFSAHAVKPFYSWGAILGAEFVRDYTVKSIAKATNEIYWDGHKFWRRAGVKNLFVGLDMPELKIYFQSTARLSTKPDKVTGSNQITEALNHIFNHNRVEGAAPFAGQKSGLITFMNKTVLNTYVDNSVVPHDKPCVWPDDFPFIAALLEHIFEPKNQLEHYLAWSKYAYQCVRSGVPQPGQNTFMMGEVASGKTLLNREILGRLLGGYMDASEFLIRGGQFNSELFDVPMWVVDDETPSGTDSQRNNFAAMLKKCTANNTFRHNKKFQVATLTAWAGRIGCTTNLDHVSTRILGAMDNSSRDKTNLFRCSKVPFVFPSREQTIYNIQCEISKYGRWLLDWPPPSICIPDPRFGFKSYQEPTLLHQAQQGSSSASFKEILFDSFATWLEDHPKATFWQGGTVAILRLILATPLNDTLFRSLKIEHIARCLETVSRDYPQLTVVSGPNNERLWTYKPL